MNREVMYNMISVFWGIVIIISIVDSIVDIKKYKSLGNLLYKNQKKLTSYKAIALMFIILFILSLNTLITQNYSFSLITSTGLFICAVKVMIQAINTPKIFENGILTGNAVLGWNEISKFCWNECTKQENIELQLESGYKKLLIKTKDENIKITIKKNQMERLQDLLDNKITLLR